MVGCRLVGATAVATNWSLRTMRSILLVITATFRRSRNFLSHHPQSKCFERIVDAQPCVYQLLVRDED